MSNKIFTVIDIFIAILIMLFSVPFLNFCYGYILGFVLSHTIGNIIINTFLIFNIHLTLEQLPTLFGTIALIVGFLSSFQDNRLKIDYSGKNSKLRF